MRYGIMGEDTSDAETIKVLLKKLHESTTDVHFHLAGFNGCSAMFRKGIARIKLFARHQCNRIVIAYDADGPAEIVEKRRRQVIEQLINPSGVNARYCALIPTQEIEAWILAQLDAVTKVFNSWKPSETYAEPERVKSPKEELIKLSRDPRTRKARYVPNIHNSRVAEHLDVTHLKKKCPSFKILMDFVEGHLDHATKPA